MTFDSRFFELPWYRQLVLRLWPLFWLKGIGTSIFMSLFFVAYIHTLKFPASQVTEMPLLALDHWVPFNPTALPLYLSLWLYTSLPPSLLVRRDDLVRYGWSIGAVCVLGLICFYLYPSAVPSPDIDTVRYPAFAFLKAIDSSGNACPSLHVASAVFSGLWLHRLLREMSASRNVLWINALWCLGILYSTLATKQHVALDLFAGLALGLLGAYLSLRWIKPLAGSPAASPSASPATLPAA